MNTYSVPGFVLGTGVTAGTATGSQKFPRKEVKQGGVIGKGLLGAGGGSSDSVGVVQMDGS